jgi:uncharacterized protein (TIGR02145 family)
VETWNGVKWISFCDDSGGGSSGPGQGVVNGSGGNTLTFMTYNLGASSALKWMTADQQAAHTTAADTYGDLYQWGRKADGHEKRTSPRYPTNDGSAENGVVSGAGNFDANGQIIAVHSAYGKFIKQDAYPIDWRSPQIDALWNSGTESAPAKTANDPCPAGWRVPTNSEWQSVMSENQWTWVDTPIPGCKISPDGGTTTTLFLPAAGIRHFAFGALLSVGTLGSYISSTAGSSYSRSLAFHSTSVSNSLVSRAQGASVRCVAE